MIENEGFSEEDSPKNSFWYDSFNESADEDDYIFHHNQKFFNQVTEHRKQINAMIHKNPLLNKAITFKLEKYGEDQEIDENVLPLFEEPIEPNRELVQIQKVGIPGAKDSNKVNSLWLKLKNQATQNAGSGKKRKPVLKQINQRLNIFKAEINKPDILDLFSSEVLQKAAENEEAKTDEKAREKKDDQKDGKIELKNKNTKKSKQQLKEELTQIEEENKVWGEGLKEEWRKHNTKSGVTFFSYKGKQRLLVTNKLEKRIKQFKLKLRKAINFRKMKPENKGKLTLKQIWTIFREIKLEDRFAVLPEDLFKKDWMRNFINEFGIDCKKVDQMARFNGHFLGLIQKAQGEGHLKLKQIKKLLTILRNTKKFRDIPDYRFQDNYLPNFLKNNNIELHKGYTKLEQFKMELTNYINYSQNCNNRFLYVDEIRKIFLHFKELPKYDVQIQQRQLRLKAIRDLDGDEMDLEERSNDDKWVFEYIAELMKGYETFIRRKVDLNHSLKLPLKEETQELLDQRRQDQQQYKEILKDYKYYKTMETFLKKYWQKQTQFRTEMNHYKLYRKCLIFQRKKEKKRYDNPNRGHLKKQLTTKSLVKTQKQSQQIVKKQKQKSVKIEIDFLQKKKKKEVIPKKMNFVSNVEEGIYQQLRNNIKKVTKEQTVRLINKIRTTIAQKMDNQRQLPPKIYPFTSEDMKKFNIYIPDFQPMTQSEKDKATELFGRADIHSDVEDIIGLKHTDNDYLPEAKQLLEGSIMDYWRKIKG